MPCIYTSPAGLCPGTAPLSKREHYLPRGLGNFRHDDRLTNKICNDCQVGFSKLEDLLLHNSPEAFFREMIGQVGRKKHRKKNIFYEPTQGISPLTVIGKHPDEECEILWEPVGEGQCRPLNQIILAGADGTLRIPYRPGALTIEKIEQQMAREKIGKLQHALFVSSEPDITAELDALCKGLVPAGSDKDLPLPKDGAEMQGEMKALVSAGYLRAIAKIGFHFLLQYFHRFTGFEPEFDGIKRFISSGEADKEWVTPIPDQFVLNLRQGTLKEWAHLLSAQADEHGIEARMQFFAGPPVQPLIWRVDLGASPSKLIYREAVGQAFIYYRTCKGDYHGERSEMPRVGPR
jgi:hypothetical protein